MVKRPRYIVVGVTGHSSGGGSHRTSYSVLDTCCCHREVFTAYVSPIGRKHWGDHRRKELCEQHAARLNALEEVSA